MTIQEFNEFVKGLQLKDTDKLVIVSIGEDSKTQCGLRNVNTIDLILAKQEIEFQLIGNLIICNKEFFKEILNGKNI